MPQFDSGLIRRASVALLCLALALGAGGCSGGGGGGGGPAATAQGGAGNAGNGGNGGDGGGGGGGGGVPPTPQDQQLRGQIAQAGVTLPAAPATNGAQVQLGQALMFDKILSGNRDVACATCHHPTQHTGDGLSLSIGVGGLGLGPTRLQGVGQQGQGLLPFIPRNAPELFNRGQAQWTTMFWDARVARNGNAFTTPAGNQLPAGLASVLAAQAMFPVTSRAEMRGEAGDEDVFGNANELAQIADTNFTGIWQALMARVLAIPAYQQMFAQAFPNVPQNQLGFQHAANAIAQFEVSAFTSFNSPFDRYLAGDNAALTDQQKRGGGIFFGRGRCSQCHNGPLLTDQLFHNIAVPQIGPGRGDEAPQDFGREEVTGNPNHRYQFRTPPLRNVALTAPYFHDGAFTTLAAAVRHYDNPAQSLQNYNPNQLDIRLRGTFQNSPQVINAIIARLDPLVNGINLNNQDVADLVAFLEALTDPAFLDPSAAVPPSVPSGLPVGN